VATVLLGGVWLTALSGCGQAKPPQDLAGPVVIATFQPFSGPNSDFGPEAIAGCYAAERLINQAGGVLGHQLDCLKVDSISDPAGPAANARRMLAAINLVAVLGPDSNDAPISVPLIDKARISMFASTGDSAYTKNSLKYFWRITPPDDEAGYAMALYAFKKGYRRGAAVFGDDPAAQANVPSILRGFKKLGGEVVANEMIAPNGSYDGQVERVVRAKPDVIFTESDPATAASFFSLVFKQRSPIAIIGTQPTLQPEWWQAVSTAIGRQTLATNYAAVQPFAPPAGQAWELYHTALLASRSKLPNPEQWSRDPYSITYYDSVIITALAMVAANSTNPIFFNPWIARVTAVQSGAVVVHSYQNGLDALSNGNTIQYIGASGPVAFNQWHNASIGFTIAGYELGGRTRLLDSMSSEAIASLSQAAEAVH
jgi:ABC-type branched-subunit amino acid transport system substrate-binding protein